MNKLFCCWILAVLSCSCSMREEAPAEVITYPTAGHGLTDEGLAQAYCGSCHQYPDPSLLSKSMWEQELLKDMGRRLGVRSTDYDPFFQRSMFDAYVLRSAGVYPLDTLISPEDWERIQAYYIAKAPEEAIPQAEKEPVTMGMPHFKSRVFDDLPAKPLTTMVKFDTVREKIYWGSRMGDFMVVNPEGKVERQLQINSAVSEVVIDGSNEYILTMGTMDPTEEAVGILDRFEIGAYQGDQLLNKLQRPVHFTPADLDQDGNQDLIVAQFGDQTGKLSWFQKNDTGYVERIIKKVPGIIRTEVKDFNEDGRLDIMALMTQGNEGISIFYNKGKGRFTEKRILRFPPVYGSSSFQLADFNGDQKLDILYTAGDNADFSYSLKSYHGVRIYINQGDDQYLERFFYPMHGAMNALAGDFDNDGDLDIAAISFFPDFQEEHPEGFVYLENEKGLQFKGFTFPEVGNGRWLVMDAADYDRDGDLDLVLGSLLFKINSAPEELIARWTESNYHMLVLENTIN